MNMFVALCVIVSLSMFLLTTALGLVAVSGFFRLCRYFKVNTILRSPALLFLLRTFPLALALVVTFGFTAPSFLLLEPRQTAETPEPYLVTLALLGVLLIAVVMWRFVRLILGTR